MIAGEIHGTVINNHSGRYDYGPWTTTQTLDSAAKLFNCMGIQITGTQYYPPEVVTGRSGASSEPQPDDRTTVSDRAPRNLDARVRTRDATPRT